MFGLQKGNEELVRAVGSVPRIDMGNQVPPGKPGERDGCTNVVYLADNLTILPQLPADRYQVVYIDPPFNTGKTQSRTTLRTSRSADGDRIGFKGQTYLTTKAGTAAYADDFDDYLAFLEPRLKEAWRLLHPNGTFYLHLDYREVHYAKVMLDSLFGRECFLNEIIWAYDYGARSTRKWPTKHDNILVYVKDPQAYWFDSAAVDREPYMAPGLVTPEKRERGKLPTDVWWHTIVSPTGKEKTGYPTQKPEGVLRRVITASTRPGDWVIDFFAGSGTTGRVAAELGRRFVMIDNNPEAVSVMQRRLGHADTVYLDHASKVLPPLTPAELRPPIAENNSGLSRTLF